MCIICNMWICRIKWQVYPVISYDLNRREKLEMKTLGTLSLLTLHFGERRISLNLWQSIFAKIKKCDGLNYAWLRISKKFQFSEGSNVNHQAKTCILYYTCNIVYYIIYTHSYKQKRRRRKKSGGIRRKEWGLWHVTKHNAKFLKFTSLFYYVAHNSQEHLDIFKHFTFKSFLSNSSKSFQVNVSHLHFKHLNEVVCFCIAA